MISKKTVRNCLEGCSYPFSYFKEKLDFFKYTILHPNPKPANLIHLSSLEREPINYYLDVLGRAQNMPERIYLLLRTFSRKYGLLNPDKHPKRLFYRDKYQAL